MSAWAYIDGTARFAVQPQRGPGHDRPHRHHVGWYEGDVPACGNCAAHLEPVSVTRQGVATAWRSRSPESPR